MFFSTSEQGITGSVNAIGVPVGLSETDQTHFSGEKKLQFGLEKRFMDAETALTP